jgi:2-amino-4-hydroxy-6-hydroxymethyldihydropteridine diphosphokinase
MINDDTNKTVRERPRSVYLGLGTNLGDRESNLNEAINRIKLLGLEVVRASSIYETEPVGYTPQPWFLNQVVELRVDADVRFESWPRDLLGALLDIEREMGRERDIVNGPRVIDIDILLCDDEVGFFAGEQSGKEGTHRSIAVAPPFLTLPHPRMHERRFVLEPLAEIAPDLVHPLLKKSCRELLDSLDDSSTVRLYKSSGR